VEADGKLTANHLAEVNKSIASVTAALKKVSEAFETRAAEQEHRIAELAKAVRDLSALGGKSREDKSSKSDKGARRSGQTGETRPPVQEKGSREAETVEKRAAKGAETQYELSLALLRRGELEAAQKEFTEFLETYPDSKLAGNAQYWLGECYYGAKEYRQAIEAFERVHQAYPNSPTVPAALLKKGLAYLALHEREQALLALKQVVEVYPQSPEAIQAAKHLAHVVE
jgi:tol-pal system protein YbgF